jgi:hypothetical protein
VRVGSRSDPLNFAVVVEIEVVCGTEFFVRGSQSLDEFVELIISGDNVTFTRTLARDLPTGLAWRGDFAERALYAGSVQVSWGV